MAKPLQSVLEWVATHFRKDASKMLIFTGVAGWTLSSLAQICGILFNPEIENKQKVFLATQEFSDAAVNIGSFFLVTQIAKRTVSKMFSTGKLAPKSVRAFLDKNKEIFANKVGKLDFDLDDVLKANPDFPKEAYYTCKNFGTTLATVGAGVLSSNIITPIARNHMASGMQKQYLATKEKEAEISSKPTLKTNSYMNYIPKSGLKI